MPILLKAVFHETKFGLSEDLVLSIIKVDYLVDLLSIHKESWTLHFADKFIHAQVCVDFFKIVDETALVLALNIVVNFLKVHFKFVTLLIETFYVKLLCDV